MRVSIGIGGAASGRKHDFDEQVDITAADIVAELDDSLHTKGIELCFAEMKDPVKDKLKRFELFARFGSGFANIATD